jgi:hypothetical protein
MSSASYVRKWLEINGTPIEVEKIVDYCIRKENGKVFDDWGKDIITTMVTYHMLKKTISVIKDGDEVVGVHMWYTCNYDDGWEFIRGWEEDRKDGDSIFLAFLFAENRKVLKELTLDLLAKEPDVLIKKLIGIRHRHGVPTKVDLSIKYFNKLLKA